MITIFNKFSLTFISKYGMMFVEQNQYDKRGEIYEIAWHCKKGR